MRPLFRGEGCAINEAGISTAGNPLTRAFDAVTNDPLRAQQMREGYLGGMRPPMVGPDMLGPMSKPGSSFEAAWQEAGPMRPPMAMGPGMGASMPEQLRQHMQRGPGADEAGFFSDGLVMPNGARAPGPQMMMRPQGPRGPDWAAEFASGSQRMGADMDAAFHQAQMDAAFAQGQMARPAGPMPAGPSGMEQMGHQMPMPMMGMGMSGGLMGAGMMPLRSMMPRMSEPMPMQQASSSAPAASVMQEAKAEVADVAAAEQTDLGQAAQMVEMLRNSGNPKFANSQFVSFIDKVSKGDLKFKENTVIDRNGHEVDWDSLYDTEVATASVRDQKELETMWQASSGAAASSMDPEAVLNKAWETAKPGAQGQSVFDGIHFDDDELEKQWLAAGQSAMDDAMLDQAWAAGGFAGMEQMFTSGAARHDEYKFEKDNEFMGEEDPLALAQRLLREGRDREALLALEAEVQRNPESSEGWRQLGQLYAEMDQDVEAIQCLRKGHEVDPYNLDSLLALGVSCTNELDQLPALRYLRRWIENHEEHQVLAQNMEPPPEYDYEGWRQQVTALFNQAAEQRPTDADVFVALGVMENINRNYEGAVRALATACRLRPNDHTVWNKLGATLANSGKSEQAVVAYHQGLTLKPNYARSWSNLAIAHANLGQHEDAARFYLSSLVLNPEATHIWNFLHSAVLNMKDAGTLQMQAIDQRDLAACSKAIDGVLDPKTLPKPVPELPQPPNEILGSIGL